jgi:hypothetical protein
MKNKNKDITLSCVVDVTPTQAKKILRFIEKLTKVKGGNK